ncbi:UDP:flavonoid glycosyltransferase YjiC (YdhE family) [Crossiella equi]|uniref:UDP:flavonoid glycosyltransferase YjiC (YdhE family) n=1 Tax=Crossiella equi TaxID=130796 RepID=A0ABS5A4W5_9PSEU|nr:glycosyltransferase [Crossiella equi]MBP2471327.1 UDP:flavonoid glycosyltransferase YjiC (YdhE family) [Crossiella equi]
MRILFTFIGGNGHFQPLVPLARAARAAGHTVAVAGGAGMRATVEAAGFTAFPIGTARAPGQGMLGPLVPLDPAKEDRDLREGFARTGAAEHAAALLTLGRDWKPDLLVRDEVDFGAAVAAEVLGVRCVSVVDIIAGGFLRPAVIAEPLHELRAAHGLPADPGLAMLHRGGVLSPVPARYRDPADPLPEHTGYFRPCTARREPPRERPGIYFTLGTIFNRESGDLFTRVLTGLRELPADIVVTVGRHLDPADLGPQPAHVRIERYLPQEEVLPGCDLVVSHGGSGSVTGALAHGLPLLVLPLGADQPGNARRCTALGVGHTLDPVTTTPDQVHTAAATLLADPEPARLARELAVEIAALPDPADVLATLG